MSLKLPQLQELSRPSSKAGASVILILPVYNYMLGENALFRVFKLNQPHDTSPGVVGVVGLWARQVLPKLARQVLPKMARHVLPKMARQIASKMATHVAKAKSYFSAGMKLA
jgi:hypothetical protein